MALSQILASSRMLKRRQRQWLRPLFALLCRTPPRAQCRLGTGPTRAIVSDLQALHAGHRSAANRYHPPISLSA